MRRGYADGKRGIRTERGDMNRAIGMTNNHLRQLRARIKTCKDWLYSQPLTNAPIMRDMMNGITDGQNLKSRWKRLADLKTAAKVLCFLQDNNITDMEQLADTVTKMYEHFYEVSNKIKATERRLGTLTEHLAHYEKFKQHKAVYQKCKQLDPKKRDAFYKKHSDEIERYEVAKSYLDRVMNGKTPIPVKACEKEALKLTAEKYELFDEYYRLKGEVQNVETLKRGAESLMRGIMLEHIQARKRDITL